MGQFEVYNGLLADVTLISNLFLDVYMPCANGEFVKIYLYLLRHSAKQKTLDLPSIADTFNCTEADVLRALRYWKKTGVLELSFAEDQTLECIVFLPLSEKKEASEETGKEKFFVPPETASSVEKTPPPELTPGKVQHLEGNGEIRQILFIAEQYLGKTLSSTDIEALLYLYDEASLSVDLLEYLIEYCVSKGSTSMAYIKKVGLAWAQENITTVNQAKEETNLYNKNYFTILKAFGIKNRNPLDKEIQYMNLWINQYGFSLDIISEACSRTVLSTGKASFSYADSILETWYKKGVRSLSDIDFLDVNFQQKKAGRTAPRPKAADSKNKFNNFHQRSYNMTELEKQLLSQ